MSDNDKLGFNYVYAICYTYVGTSITTIYYRELLYYCQVQYSYF